MKDKYREETNKDVYSNDMCCGCGGSDGSYSDEYVKWLESEVKVEVLVANGVVAD